MGFEYELKYRATPQVQQLLRREIPGEEQVFAMETTYYDTPTEQFSARRWTLRRRLENGRSICTLKMPAGGPGRKEWEIPCPSITEAVPKLCKLGVPEEAFLLAQEGLIPICGARFTRIAKTLHYGSSTLELALDQGILTGGSTEIPLCEIEVELKNGTAEDCLQYAQQLADTYHLIPEDFSKFRRALALYKGE